MIRLEKSVVLDASTDHLPRPSARSAVAKLEVGEKHAFTIVEVVWGISGSIR
jgi:hypothetical protein